MADILEDSDYEAVRVVLGVTTRDVSDTVLNSVIAIPAAEVEVKTRITDWATVLAAGGVDATRLKLGTIYNAAANLIPRLRQTLRPMERVGELIMGNINWDKMRDELVAKADEALGAIGGSADDQFTLFTVGGPSRKYRTLEEIGQESTADFVNI